ncbi:hypothetical protein GRAQ_02777 [Rahnella aquatilis CIP 78.65 = ATCC 33071]|nr:hypothetical protein [Rahnella aquatilis]KFD03131.1 hypothetical protein GRAQ_02777 [Rahnella aquatilis CIP 78.65 = ATCC 33071]
MDTVEELNGTYFYAGKSNLTAGKLFFMICCENVINKKSLRVLHAVLLHKAGVGMQWFSQENNFK